MHVAKYAYILAYIHARRRGKKRRRLERFKCHATTAVILRSTARKPLLNVVENSLQSIQVSCAIELPPPKFINVARNLLTRYSSLSPKEKLHSSPQPFYAVCVDRVVHGQVGVDIFQRLQMEIRLTLVRPDGRMGSKVLVDERIQRLTVTPFNRTEENVSGCAVPHLDHVKNPDFRLTSASMVLEENNNP